MNGQLIIQDYPPIDGELEKLKEQWQITDDTTQLSSLYIESVTRFCKQSAPLVARLLICVKLDLKELGIALYERFQEDPIWNVIEDCVNSLIETIVMEHGCVRIAEWVHNLKNWKWKSSSTVSHHLLLRGDFCLIDWLLNHGVFHVPYTLKDSEFALSVLKGICKNQRLEDLKLFTQRLQEDDDIMCAMSKSEELMFISEILSVTDDACATFLLTESVFCNIQNYHVIFLFICLLSEKPLAAAILASKYQITANHLTNFINDVPKCAESAIWRFTEETCNWAQDELGVKWDKLQLSGLNILFEMMRQDLAVPHLRVLTTIAPQLPNSIWDFLLLYPQLWDDQYHKRKYGLYKNQKYCCGVYHYILSEKLQFLTKDCVTHVSSVNPFMCIRHHATSSLPRVTAQNDNENSNTMSPSEIYSQYDETFCGYTVRTSTPLEEFCSVFWLPRITSNCQNSCCPIHYN